MEKMFRWTLGGVLLCSCMCAAVADGPEDEKKDNKNYVPATLEYGTLDKNINIADLKKKVKEGDIVSMYNLGLYYHIGQNVTLNYKTAVKYYKMALEKGAKKKSADSQRVIAAASNNLALLYLNGQGVEKDAAKAVELYTVAANLGNAISQRKLGECYEKGEGVEENAAEAVKWYAQAAEKKDAVAMTNLARCYALGNGVEERDLVIAANWYRQAAEQGYTEAQYNYGRCLMNGVGVARNFDEGLAMYKIAADKRHMEA
jgi:TPR repeat protein